MTDLPQDLPGGPNDVPDEDLTAVYGPTAATAEIPASFEQRKREFKPWHHPVKQIVRARQWAALTVRLIEEGGARSGVLRYFTLPGPDLLDVRLLAEVCAPRGVRIEYFGFDMRAATEAEQASEQSTAATGSAATTAESALLQAGRTTADAVILPDRLEDIALADSQASSRLRQQLPFDVINVDTCDHLAYRPRGRPRNTFDALRVLLSHQMVAPSPWLLFITTRTVPTLLGAPGVAFQQAITSNIQVAPDTFGGALASAIEADTAVLASALASAWGKHDLNFLRLYCIGLGKFLLQFFHGQPNHPANVELASAYAYRVHDEEPDMLALAFRITPDQRRIFEPNVGGAAVIPSLEPERAAQVAMRAQRLWDIDQALETQVDIRREAVDGTEALLQLANYDIPAWRQWLANLKRRPVILEGPAATA